MLGSHAFTAPAKDANSEGRPAVLLAQNRISEEEYERARQKLQESLQSANPTNVSKPTVNPPPPVTTGAAPAQAASSSATASGGSPKDEALQKALQNLDELIHQTPSGPAGATPAAVLAANADPRSAANSPAEEIPAAMKLLDDKQKLGVQDRISFRVLEDREDPKALQVTDSGEVEVPYVGRYKAQDKTCYQLACEVKGLLEKEYYHHATVMIGVDALNKMRGKVYVVGQVKGPGPVELPGDEVYTVSKCILKAGGFGDFAKKKEVKLMRKADPATGKPAQTFIINVEEIWEKNRTEKDIVVQSDDMIYVAQKLINF